MTYYSSISGFPERAAPVSLYPKIDLSDRFLSYDRLNNEILRYRLALFNPSRYVREEHRARPTIQGAIPERTSAHISAPQH